MASQFTSGAFWGATFERMIRSAAAAILSSTLVVDGMFDLANLQSLKDALTIGAGAAVFTLLFSLAGNAISGGGPAIGNSEKVVSSVQPPVG